VNLGSGGFELFQIQENPDFTISNFAFRAFLLPFLYGPSQVPIKTIVLHILHRLRWTPQETLSSEFYCNSNLVRMRH